MLILLVAEEVLETNMYREFRCIFFVTQSNILSEVNSQSPFLQYDLRNQKGAKGPRKFAFSSQENLEDLEYDWQRYVSYQYGH